ncbi:MAG: DNA polymerase I, partial [Candidatus Omnitrophota bacterium]
ASSDKDMLQLVDANVLVYNPYRQPPLVDADAVCGRFGVAPGRIVDLISLCGDASDNIPGVKGIGEKTARKLIDEYGGMRELFARLDEVMPLRVRMLLRRGQDSARLSYELATLRRDVPLDISLDRLKVAPPDYHRLRKIFGRLEFKSLLSVLNDADSRGQAPVAAKKTDKPIVLDSPAAVQDLVAAIKARSEMIFSLDCLVGDGKKPGRGGAVKGVLVLAEEKAYYISRKYLGLLKGVFGDKEIKKTGHNLKRQKDALCAAGVALEGLYFDIMLAAYILDPSRHGYALSDLVAQYCPQGASPDPALSLGRLREIFHRELKQRDQQELFFGIEMPLVSVLQRMEYVGVRIDRDVLREISRDTQRRIALLTRQISQAAGQDFNINSPKQLRFVLFERLKLPVVKRTKTGPSTDEEVLHKLAAAHSLPKMILDYRQLVKLKSTYIDPLPMLVDSGSGRLHTSFNQAVTRTGRLSSSHPNLQNIPARSEEGRRIRRAFVPGRKDSLLLSGDYSQIELRILAHLSRDQALVKAFVDDKDVHSYAAGLIFDVEQEAVTVEMRDKAKRVNFGIIYGISSFGLSKDLAVSRKEAEMFIDAYFLRYPGVRQYMERTAQEARRRGFTATLLGRRRYLPGINSGNNQLRMFAERQAINAPIQGTASDMIKLAMIEIDKEIMENKWESRLIIQVHDELIFDVPRREKDAFSAKVRDVMEGVLQLCVPVKVDIKSGESWYDL